MNSQLHFYTQLNNLDKRWIISIWSSKR